VNIETLKKDKIAAMKAGDIQRKNVLTDMIDTIQKAAITPKGRIEITEQLVDDTLVKYQKTVQEMIDTCPADHLDKLAEYQQNMEIVKEYAKQLITDREVIKTLIMELLDANGITCEKANKGKIMKVLAPTFKGKADMKIVNSVLEECF
jgi:hypothetical protein